MKHLSQHKLLFAVATAIATSASAHAQTPPPAPATPPTPRGVNNAITVFTGEPAYFSMMGSDPSLQKKIKLDIKGKNAAEVFKKIAEQAEIEIVVDTGALSDRKYTVQAEGFTAQSALNGIANFEGVRWRYENINGKKQLHISKVITGAASQPILFSPASKEWSDRINAQVKNRMALAQQYVYDTRLISKAALPDTRVKIDVRDADVRDVLKDILNQANLPYALEDDVPTGQKRSFTFENVPISMALDIITTSIGVGWSSESQRTAAKNGASATPALPLIRVGKKYTGRTQLFGNLAPATTFNITTTTGDDIFPAVPTPPATIVTP